jgi:stress response protein YsnF
MNAGGTETAYFHDADSAQQAIEELEAAGIARSDIHVSSHASGGGGFLDSIKRFFSGETNHDAYAGGTIVTVNDDRGLARPILTRYDARFEGDTSGTGTTTGYGTTTTATSGAAYDTTDDRTLKLREERLSVDKQTVKQGEVHLGKDVVTETQTIDVPVTREEVYVTRRCGRRDR